MDGLQQYNLLFSHPTLTRKKLNQDSLPAALQYLTRHELLVGKQRGEWLVIRCPAHKNGAERNPSMRVSAVDGHFKCMACGAKGGDILALHRLITGMNFIEAVRDLGGNFDD